MRRRQLAGTQRWFFGVAILMECSLLKRSWITMLIEACFTKNTNPWIRFVEYKLHRCQTSLCERQIHPVKIKTSIIKEQNPFTGADPGFFSGGGALVSCSTSTPINHIVFFFLQNTSCIRKPQVILGEGGCAPLHPPPRSSPDLYSSSSAQLAGDTPSQGWKIVRIYKTFF